MFLTQNQFKFWVASLFLTNVLNHFLFFKIFFYLEILSRNKFLISLISLKICFKTIRALKAFKKILGFPDDSDSTQDLL